MMVQRRKIQTVKKIDIQGVNLVLNGCILNWDVIVQIMSGDISLFNVINK